MRLDTLRMFRKAVNSRHGKTIGRAGNMRKEHIPRLTTGSLAFDFALGGGIPVGRVTEIAGETSSGKTTSALRIAALAQKLCANCLRPAKDFKVIEIGEDEDGEIEYAAEAYCDCYKEGIFEPKPYVDEYSDREKGTLKQCEVECEDVKKKKSTLFKERLNKYEENSYEEFRVCLFNFEDMMDMKWLKQIGVDTRLLILDESGTAEEGIDIYDNLIKTGSIHLFILDSIAAMTPSIEVEESTEKDQYAAQAKLVTKFVRKAVSSSVDCARNFGFRPTHIWINQLRDNFGKDAQWNPYKKPGGNAIKFARSVGVHMRPSKWDRVKADTDIAKMYQSDVGNEVQINFKVEKNKTATAQSTGYYIMKAKGRNKGQIDEEKYVLEHAIRYGIYRTDGVGNKKRWFVSDEEYSTKGAALARIEEPAVFEALKKSLLKRMLEGLNSSE